MRNPPVLLGENPVGEAQPLRIAYGLEPRIAFLERPDRVIPARKCQRLAEIAPYAEERGLLDDRPDIVQHNVLEPLRKLRRHDHRDDAAARGADDIDALDAEVIEETQRIQELDIG